MRNSPFFVSLGPLERGRVAYANFALEPNLVLLPIVVLRSRCEHVPMRVSPSTSAIASTPPIAPCAFSSQTEKKAKSMEEIK